MKKDLCVLQTYFLGITRPSRDPTPFQPFLAKSQSQLVSYRTERVDHSLGRRSNRIRQRPVQPFHSAGDDGTDFVGAECNNEIGVLDIDGIDGLGRVRPDVDADLRHHGNGVRIHARRLTAGALNVHTIAKQVTRQPFRHLAAGGIGDAEKDKPRRRHPVIIDQ